jgi:hypothetical protein
LFFVSFSSSKEPFFLSESRCATSDVSTAFIFRILLFSVDSFQSSKRLVAGLTVWRLGFDARTVCMRNMVDKVALEQVLSCQYHSTDAPYSFIHLPPTLYNVSVPVLQFSPVSIIPPMLHTHSFIYHRRCIMFFSQYFSFPCQYHSTIAP